jgi:nucleoside-diphosphate-sugar epimerase
MVINKKIKKIIITGGLGHIGSYILQKLLKTQTGIHIVVIDNLYSQRYSSLFNLNKNNLNKVSFYDQDIRDISKNNKIFKNSQILIHFAARTEAEKSLIKKKEFLFNNLQATKKVIEIAKKYNSLLIFPSSTSVYGSSISNDLIFEDDDKKLIPQSPYAEIKLKEEKLIKKELKKNKYVILRLGTVIGVSTGMRFHTAVNKFSYQASLNKKITVWKSAFRQVRPYATLNDIFKSILIFIYKNNNKINEIYNVVTKNLSVQEVVNIIQTQKKIRITFVNSKIMNKMTYKISNKKLTDLGFKPQANVKKEIVETLKLFNLDNEIN